MTFDNFAQDPFTPYSLLIAIGGTGVISVLIVMGFIGFHKLKERTGLIFCIVSLVGLFGLSMFAWNMQTISDEIDDKNQVIAEKNLKQKYDIEEVLWEKVSTYPESYDLTDIVIQDKENNILKYGYKIDRETREPQLLNEEENTPIKSKDLLLNKSEK